MIVLSENPWRSMWPEKATLASGRDELASKSIGAEARGRVFSLAALRPGLLLGNRPSWSSDMRTSSTHRLGPR